MTDRMSTERLAEWMIASSYATGHGDDLASLVAELDWQHKKRIASLESDLARATALEGVIVAAEAVNKHFVEVAQVDASLHSDTLYRDYMPAHLRELDEAFQAHYEAKARALKDQKP